MLNKILVPVRSDGKGAAVLAHAAALAHRFASHVVVAHCRARPEDMMPYGVPLPAFARDTLLKQAYEVADQEEQALREKFGAQARALGLSESDPRHGDTPTVAFIEEPGRMVDVIKHHGRLADLIAVPKPDRDRNVGSNSLKAALFRTGRPVMMCPETETVTPDLAKRIAIGWNGSVEAARAVALTIDLLSAADEVTVITGPGVELHGATTDELVDYLGYRGIAPKVSRFDSGNVGEALLKAARDAGATTLVMGAYGDSHERETLFGGNTQAVVDRADLPVILVH